MAAEVEGRWAHIRKVLNRHGPFVDYGEDFVPDSADSPSHFKYLRALEESGDKNCKILVIGAGGLGCELLKNLALSGFRDIHVVDMDTIDLSNLNRQFLFRETDIGKPKAEVAARFVNERVPGTNITAHYAKLQDMDDDFYSQFNLVIAGLDSIVARRWMNTTLLNMVVTDDDGDINPDTIIPFIDGGTEGWKGQARVILPRVTACFECTIELFPPKTAYPMCTLANTPRVPEHCIEYAKLVQWPRDWPFGKDTKPDMDDPLHLKWMYEHSLKRAEEFGIQGVTMSKTKGVVKNIIPAIASTNAIVSAACTNEAFKYVTNCSGYLNNYMFYSGLDGIYTYTFEYFPKESCLACGVPSRPMTLDPEQLVGDFLEELKDHPDLQMEHPSVRCGGRNTTIYMAAPKLLERKTRPNLSKPLKEFIHSGDVLDVTDPALPGVAVVIPVTFSKAPIESAASE